MIDIKISTISLFHHILLTRNETRKTFLFAHLFHIITKSVIIIKTIYVWIEAGPQYDKSTGKKIKPCEAPIRTNPSNIRKK